MFTEYREILEIACSKTWDTEKHQEQMETVLCDIEENPDYCFEVEGFVLIDLLKKLCLEAFQSKDHDLFNLVITTLIELDKAKDDMRPDMDNAFAETNEEDVPEKEKDKEEETEAVADEGGRMEPEEIEPLSEDDEILDSDYSVRKNTLNYILANVNGDAFSINDIQATLREYYNDVLKKPEITNGSMQVYSNSYARYMVDKDMVTRDEIEGAVAHERSLKRFHLVKKEDKTTIDEQGKIDRFSLSKQAQYILLWAEKNSTDIIEVEAIFTHAIEGSIKPYSEKALLRAFEELEKKGIARKVTKGRYIVRRKMVAS